MPQFKESLLNVRKVQYTALQRLLHFYDDGDNCYPVEDTWIYSLNDLLRSKHADEKVTAAEMNTPAEITDTYTDGGDGSAHNAISLHLILNNALSTISGLQQGPVTDEQQAEADKVLKDAAKSLLTALGFDVEFP